DREHFTRKLTEDVRITGGADESQLTNSNIGVVVGDQGLEVKLAKNINGLETIKTTGRITAGDLTVTTGGLTVNNGGIKVTRDGLTVQAGPTLLQETTVKSTLNVEGDTTVRKLTANGETTLKRTTITEGGLTVQAGPTNLNGTATIGGKLTARSGLDVTGATTLRNTLNVTGDTTLRGTTAN
ncbi:MULTISPECIES: hypothetical protein, partial [unclassified Moraxella]|uniref:hypothetical protein n=1 Tax=unclassified Moraxella TaxID=2685852 RepID=UPI00359ECA70